MTLPTDEHKALNSIFDKTRVKYQIISLRYKKSSMCVQIAQQNEGLEGLYRTDF